MHKFYQKLTFFVLAIFSASLPFQSFAGGCDVYADAFLLNRTTALGEEQVVFGNYQGVAQQFNAVSGQITSVIFWGRVNPASGSASNTLKIKIYAENIGLPGVVLGTQNVVVDSASQDYKITATFASPVTVSGNIIISIEPFSPTVDNFFVQRNTHPDGQMLYLNKLKQNNQWFKNLAAGGDTTLNFDFMILPVKTNTLTAGFTHSATGNTTNFFNASMGASTYLWDFGDGDTSAAVSPSHNYAATGTYTVVLKAFANGIATCMDTVASSVPVVITAINPVPVKKAGITLASGMVQDVLILESGMNTNVRIMDVLGNLVGKYNLKQNEKNILRIDGLRPGIYLITSDMNKPIRFIKTK
jgi:hypothetical protein